MVVPAYGVEEWLDECLASLVAQTLTRWEAVVVDDGSVDRSGRIAADWAARDRRIRVVRTPNQGLGAARNHGSGLVRGQYLAFLDADDVLPPTAYQLLVASLDRTGSDFAVGSMARWEDGRLTEPGWMRRLHRPAQGLRIEERPELLGDVFAWNKVWRRSFWDAAALSWPERIRYEDQPTLTRSFVAGRFDVLADVVYHWRIRSDGTSITQQRGTVADLRDRWETKRMSLRTVRDHGSPAVEEIFVDRVLAGDLWRYFDAIPGCDDAWWRLLQDGVTEFWAGRSLTGSGLPPAQRLVGWLVEQDRRDDATAVVTWLAALPARPPRETDPDSGRPRLSVPAEVLDVTTVAAEALAVRPHER
ncbi:glycosyltransferase family 2 protein [Nocardioides sambongensis]|uniref:glycosyltransferase family 2 protein n=1 Tax=Nocardioides sambongensis TaxID=2589074 RepID=UPI001E3D8FE4|nr:glycosyltransferase family 2 protein [Nocardioides sambongensis]